MAECPACGAEVNADATECPQCGAPVSEATAAFEPVDAGKLVAPTECAPAEGLVLVVRKGPQQGEKFFIDRPKLSVGRDPESDIFLNDMTVSRSHATIECAGDTVTVKDSGSLNGTYVNGQIVEAADLRSGDVVQIGTFQMVFVGSSEEGRVP